jgi:uncharacterized protein
VSTNRDLLRLNIGFLVHQNVGYSRDFPFEFPAIHLPPDLDLRKLTGVVRVTRLTQGLLVQIRMRARLFTECVRCLKAFYQPLKIESTELYAFTQNSITDSGLLVPETGKIDLAPIIREEMLVAVPIRPLCKVNCKGLCPICGEDQNGVTCNHQEDDIDPRLELLKSLLADG